ARRLTPYVDVVEIHAHRCLAQPNLSRAGFSNIDVFHLQYLWSARFPHHDRSRHLKGPRRRVHAYTSQRSTRLRIPITAWTRSCVSPSMSPVLRLIQATSLRPAH